MYVILSIDGGGCKGLIAAEFIRNIYINNPAFMDTVDCIVGVSSGSLVGSMLAANITPVDTMKIFKDRMKLIFQKKCQNMCSCWGLRRPKYSNCVLWNAIYDVIGEMKMSELNKNFICYSYDMKHARANVFLNHGDLVNEALLPTGNDYYIINNNNQSVTDAVYQSCLAPTYFHDENGVIDGSVMTNNPTMIAVGIARSYYNIPVEEIRVLSIGTKERIQMPLRRSVSILFWLKNIIYLLMDASCDHTKFLCDMLLGNRYLRIEVPCRLPINSYKNRDVFIDMGHKAYVTYRELIFELFLKDN